MNQLRVFNASVVVGWWDFLLENLWFTDHVLGWYRLHSSNRSLIHHRQNCREVRKAIHAMKSQCSSEIKKKMIWVKISVPLKRIVQKLGLKAGDNFLSPLCQEMNYYRLRYQNRKWVKTVVSFVH